MRTKSLLALVALSLLTPALAGGAIITSTVDLTIPVATTPSLGGLAARATFLLNTASPSTLVITLQNISTGTPSTDEANQILAALSFDLGAPGLNVADPNIAAGSVVIGPGGTSINFDHSPVLSAGADVSAEWGYCNEGVDYTLVNRISCLEAGQTIRMATGNLDGSDKLDGPQGGVVRHTPLVTLSGLGAIGDSVVATLTLDKPLTDLSFLDNGVRAEFGSNFRNAEGVPPPQTPEPATLSVLVMGGVLAIVRRQRRR